MSWNKNFLPSGAGAAALFLFAVQAQAAGFQLQEQNASAMGNAYAGTAANPENASTVFFNPAGMTELPGTQVSAGINIIRPSFRYKDGGGSRNPAVPGIPGTALGGTPAAGNNGGQAGKTAGVPNVYATHQLGERVTVGVGVSVPFGLASNYRKGWKGEHHSQEFDVRSLNLNVAAAAKVNERISVGAGINIQRVEAEYARKVVVPLTASPAGPYTTGDARAKLSDTAISLNAGVLAKVSDDTRVGLAWRGGPRHSARGTTKITNIVTPKGVIERSYRAKASVSLPDSVTLSVAHEATPDLTLLADLAWYRWSKLQALQIHNAGLGTDALPLRFRDTWRAAIGATWRVRPGLGLKAGVAWDQTPVSDPAHRPAAMPDNDRLWLALGVQYQLGAASTLDVGYAHLFMKDAKIDTTSGSAVSRGRLQGEYEISADMLGVQYSSSF